MILILKLHTDVSTCTSIYSSCYSIFTSTETDCFYHAPITPVRYARYSNSCLHTKQLTRRAYLEKLTDPLDGKIVGNFTNPIYQPVPPGQVVRCYNGFSSSNLFANYLGILVGDGKEVRFGVESHVGQVVYRYFMK